MFLRRLPLRARTMHTSAVRIESLLGLPHSAPHEQVRRAYLARVKKCHPDHCDNSSEEFVALQNAWERHRKDGIRAVPQSTYLELVRFDLSGCAAADAPFVWTQQHVDAARSAVAKAVEASGQELHGETFEAPTVRRLGIEGDDGATLGVEVVANDPRHRDSVAAVISRGMGAPFLARLERDLKRAGAPELTLSLKGAVRWHTSGGGAVHRPRISPQA